MQCKTENKRRSISRIKRLLEKTGIVALGELSRSSIHRFLRSVGLSHCKGDEKEPVEYRTFNAQYASDIWYGDVLHGPSVPVGNKSQKVYLVSLMDDASRLIAHSAFCTGEKAIDIEGVLKQAILKRGLPKKLVVDNGSAYRSGSLQAICARLEIRLLFCRPFSPQGKGKLERYHRFFREAFLSELDIQALRDLSDLNARLWAWVENEYHQRKHGGLEDLSPLKRWQKDLVHIRPLGSFTDKLDEIFYHRHERKVRKDGTISFNGKHFEVPYELSGRNIMLVVDPHQDKGIQVECKDGVFLGKVTPLDPIANLSKRRRRPTEFKKDVLPVSKTYNMVELSLAQYDNSLKIGKDDE